MAKKEKKTQEVIQEASINIQELESKVNELIETIANLPNFEKINELNLNYQSIKNSIEEQQIKFSELQKNIDNLSTNLSEIEKTILDIQKYKEELEQKFEELKSLSQYIDEIIKKLDLVEELKKDYPLFKEKFPLIDHIVSQISNLSDNQIEIKNDLSKIKENINEQERELKNLLNQLENRIEQKIIEFFENYQAKVDEAQTLKLLELEEKIDKSKQENIDKINEIFNQIQNDINNKLNELFLEKIDLIADKLKNLSTASEETVYQKISSSLGEQIENKIIESVKNHLNELIIEKINTIINSYRETVFSELKQKFDEIEHKIEKIEIIDNLKNEIDFEQTQKIIQLENKLQEILKNSTENIENKITEYVLNVQSQIDAAQTQKLGEIEEKINQTQESLKNYINELIIEKINTIISNYRETVLSEIKEKFQEIEHKIEKIEIIDTLKNEIDFEQTQKIVQLENKLQEIIKNSKDEIYKDLINSIKENEEKQKNLITSLEQNINQTVDKLIQEVGIQKEKLQTIEQSINTMENKYNDFVNLVNNVSERITSIFIKPQEEKAELEYTESLPFNLDKLIELMNREDINADYLFIKSGNRPILKSRKTTAAIGKTTLKNGDVYNFITQLLTHNELKYFELNNGFEKIKTIGKEKYYITTQKMFDDYLLTIKRIPYITEDISNLPILNPDKLIYRLSGLVLFLGINNLKNKALATIINYINHKQIKRIAIIEEKISFLYKEQQSIIDLFETKGNAEIVNNIIKKVVNEEYDLIVLNQIDKNILKTVLNYTTYKNFIVNADYDNIISFYKDYKDTSDDILKTLNIYITHKVIKGALDLFEIVFVDNKVKGLIKSEDYKAIKEYLLSIEESDTQTFNESIGYLVKSGKLSKEEAIKYLQNIDNLEFEKEQEQEIEI